MKIEDLDTFIDQINPFQNTSYKSQGIIVSPRKIKSNNTVKIKYTGLLTENNAEEVYIHYGDSMFDKWSHVTDAQMEKQEDGSFEAEIPVQAGIYFHFAFHDDTGNWDNNAGENYSFQTV
jgi:hypothetical protein